MEVVDRSLTDDGIFVLHSIMGRISLGPAQSTWLNKYIFPNGELGSLAELKEAAATVVANSQRYKPDAKINGVLVAEMAKGTEVIIGVINDPFFGPVVMFGMGVHMTLKDFAGVAKSPRGVFIGIVCHFTIMPLVGLALAQDSWASLGLCLFFAWKYRERK